MVSEVSIHEVVARALVFVGALALIIGPALQARAELDEYADLIKESGADQAMRTSLAMLLGRFRPFPFDLIPQVRNAIKLFRQITEIEKWFARTEKGSVGQPRSHRHVFPLEIVRF